MQPAQDLLSTACGARLLQPLFDSFFIGVALRLSWKLILLITAQEVLINVEGNAPGTQFLLHLADENVRIIWW